MLAVCQERFYCNWHFKHWLKYISLLEHCNIRRKVSYMQSLSCATWAHNAILISASVVLSITMLARHHSIFLQARSCSSCCPSNSIKSMKALYSSYKLFLAVYSSWYSHLRWHIIVFVVCTVCSTSCWRGTGMALNYCLSDVVSGFHNLWSVMWQC